MDLLLLGYKSFGNRSAHQAINLS